MKNTKIVATVSDKRCDPELLSRLAQAGMNVVRMNSAHLDADGIARIADAVRSAAPGVALMIDTKGPEIRTTALVNPDVPCEYCIGDTVSFFGDPSTPSCADTICLNYPDIAKYLKPGDRLLIDDGELEFRITANNGIRISAIAENSGRLGSRKSVNLPGISIPLPSVTPRDRTILEASAAIGIDFVAHSFVRSAADVQAVQDILDSLHSPMKIISKIENQEGIDNFDEILAASYGIMIARGDLGIEVAIETIPGIQQKMINKCIAAHKPVIVATQMLHSMIEHPRPTRAEVTDVANAVYQRADAMMLSGETAAGKYPVEAVQFMARVAREVERELSAAHNVHPLTDPEVTNFLARQAVVAEAAVGVKAIITDAYMGAAARYIAAYRAATPVFAICYNSSVAHWLALSYGIQPFIHPEEHPNARHIPTEAFRSLVDAGHIRPDSLVAYLSGSPLGVTSLQIDTPANFLA